MLAMFTSASSRPKRATTWFTAASRPRPDRDRSAATARPCDPWASTSPDRPLDGVPAGVIGHGDLGAAGCEQRARSLPTRRPPVISTTLPRRSPAGASEVADVAMSHAFPEDVGDIRHDG